MSKEKLQEIKTIYSEGNYLGFNFHCIHSHIDELMKLAYNQALEDSGKSVFNMTVDPHNPQHYKDGYIGCLIEAQGEIKKLKI